MSGGHSPVRYTGRPRQPGDGRDNLAGPAYVTLEERLDLACANLARVQIGVPGLLAWMKEARQNDTVWGRRVIRALVDLGPDPIWQDQWRVLMEVKQQMVNERTGYDPS